MTKLRVVRVAFVVLATTIIATYLAGIAGVALVLFRIETGYLWLCVFTVMPAWYSIVEVYSKTRGTLRELREDEKDETLLEEMRGKK